MKDKATQTTETPMADDRVLAAVHITKCSRCGHEKSWNGSDILCPFQNGDIFADNWCCRQINKLRMICENAIDNKDSRFHHQYCEGQNYATINTSEIDFELHAECLYITWYKSRGRTEGMWLMNQDYPPRKPTFFDLQKIIEYYHLYHKINLKH